MPLRSFSLEPTPMTGPPKGFGFSMAVLGMATRTFGCGRPRNVSAASNQRGRIPLPLT
jgi:hypothetical protein